MPRRPSRADAITLDTLPGHHVRRLQQIAVALFMQETEAHGVTPVQYAALQAIHDQPGLDQRRLARTIGFDASTITGVVDRLEGRGLVERGPSPEDRRVRLLTLTSAGRALLDAVIPGMQRCQERLLAPLTARDRATFMRLLTTLVAANNGESRAPRVDD